MSSNFFHKLLRIFSKSDPIETSQESIVISNTMWSDYEIKQFLELLQIEHSITYSEMHALKERITDIDEYTSNGKVKSYNSEYTTFENQRITSIIELNRLEKYLNEVDKAIKRIYNGTYGICSKCNCKINKNRLIAVPTTTMSASWKIQGKCPENGIDIIKNRNNDG